MVEHETKVRVRYGEVDRMGFFYHSHYVELFDIGRTELMRSIGLSNYEIEASGIELPVCRVEVDYRKPALYDDLLTIRTRITEMPRAQIKFESEVLRNASGDEHSEPQSIASGKVTLAFMHSDTKRACRPPQRIIEVLTPLFSK